MSSSVGQDPELGHHRVDLRLGRGAQRRQLGPVADQLPQLAHLRRGDPALGQIVPAQPVGQLGGVPHVVLDAPGVPVQPQRMHQMHPGAVRLQQIGRPIPAVGALQGHLRVGAGLGDRHRQGHRVVVDLDTVRAPRRPRSSARSPTGGDADRYRHTVVAVPPGSPPSSGVGVETPSVPLHARFPSTGGALAVHNRLGHNKPLSSSAPPTRTTGPDHAKAAQRFFMTSVQILDAEMKSPSQAATQSGDVCIVEQTLVAVSGPPPRTAAAPRSTWPRHQSLGQRVMPNT